MTKEDIIRMARQVEAEGFAPVGVWPEVRRLCELAYAAGAAAERHECAKIVDGNADGCNGMTEQILRSNAAAIRARGDA